MLRGDATSALSWTLEDDSTGSWSSGAQFRVRRYQGATNITLSRGGSAALYYNSQTSADLTISDDKVYHFWRESTNTWVVIAST